MEPKWADGFSIHFLYKTYKRIEALEATDTNLTNSVQILGTYLNQATQGGFEQFLKQLQTNQVKK